MGELLSNSESKNTNRKGGFSQTAFAIGILMGLGLATLFVLRQPEPLTAPDKPLDPALSDTMLLIEQAMQQVSSDYIEEIPPEELAKAALEGMFTKLDKHSRYLDETTYQQLIEQTDGEYIGIGIDVEKQNDQMLIVSLVENSPAANSDLRIGDRILAINGQTVLEKSFKELLGHLDNQVSSTIALSIQRDQKFFDVTLVRDFISIDSVNSVFFSSPDKKSHSNTNESDGVAYIRITHFNEHTASDLETLLLDLKNTSQSLYGLIVDLRDNPGGLVNAAVEVSDLFLEAGTIVSANGRAADADFKYQARSGEFFADLPLVVLINGATASAAEIVAAALKEQDRATIVGENSYGKGLVQTISPLSSGALKMTTSRYYTPSGLSINERGIRPHIKIDDSAMVMAFEELETSKPRTLPHYLAIKDPALLRAWQHLNRKTSRDQLAMENLNEERAHDK